eukprot:TRINITY_DN5214_c0_g1_i6.p1 TRINITY_DN5214_c0_g1~~TRINITY_DN5214_c0_g1_i6.p1  ORF type:complete len:177 (-),score=26.64 TRINITY_DN5214_c0_g1_i6:188-718(-)
MGYTDNTFVANFAPTLGVDFKLKKAQINGENVKLEIWDTGGQERFRTITKSYYERAMGIILVYDCSDERSFHDIRSWLKNIENHAHKDIVKLLVAAKADIADKKVETALGRALAKEQGIEFFETSAKYNKNIEQAFASIAEQIIKNEIKFAEVKDSVVMKKKEEDKKAKKSGCCQK